VFEAVLLTVAGLQLPVIPLIEVVGKVGDVAPSQMLCEVPKLNVGVRLGFTVTLNTSVVAQIPAEGVKT
jgi:hypothetical protein